METAVNIEMHLRSLAVRMVAVTLKHLNFCDKQILQPWANQPGFPGEGEYQTPTQEIFQKSNQLSTECLTGVIVKGEAWDNE